MTILDKHWIAIINPHSGGGKGKRNWLKAEAVLKSQKIAYTAYYTERPNHIEEIIQCRIIDGFRNFLIVGGDGSLHEAINGICIQDIVPSQEITLGIIPSGTGNDWAKTHNIPDDPAKAATLLTTRAPHYLDLGRLQYMYNDQEHERFFINVAGMGFDAHVAEHYLSQTKSMGKLSYMSAVLRGLWTYHNENIKVFSEEFETNDRVFIFAVALNKYFGGGMMIAPDALPDDGLFNITLVGNITKLEVVAQLKNLFDGSFTKHPLVKQMVTDRIVIESEKPLFIQADGELLGHTPVQISSNPSAIKVISNYWKD